jgi:eukaryotic-like serine/threonine-protein kinase
VIAGRYRVRAPLGAGGSGAVYEVEELASGRFLALKTLRAGLQGARDLQLRFEREAQAMSLLAHPNIVEVLEFGTFEGGLYLVMELVRGRTLADRIDSRTLDPAEGIVILSDVLSAMAHAHALGIVHRDLKPENVMIVEARTKPVVKLLDFGVAKLLGGAEAALGGEKLTQAGFAFGSPDYMSPEQATGDPVDQRADLYAVGVMLFEVLTGRRPFVDPDAGALLRMQVLAAPPTLAEAGGGRSFSQEMEALVARALAKRRTDRFQSALEMKRALDAAVATIPRLATTPPAVHVPALAPPAPIARGRRRTLAILAPVVIVVVILVTVIASRARPPEAPAPAATATPAQGAADDGRLTALVEALRTGTTCAARLRAVLALRDLGDARAVPALREALTRRARGRRLNACLQTDAAEAIRALQRAP